MDAPQPGDVRSTADLTQTAGNALRWVTYMRIAIEVTLLAAMVVLARLIPPSAFGMFAVVLIIQELALALPMEGVGSALVQRRTIQRAHLQAGLCLSLGVGAVLAGLTLAAAQFIVHPVYGAQTASLVRLATPWFLIGAVYAVPMGVLRRRLEFTRLTFIDLTMSSARAAASIALALAGMDATALVLGNMIGMLAALGLALIFAPVPLPRWHGREARDLLPYGGPAALACMAWTGFRNGDYAVIAARLGTVQAAYYYRAYQLAVEYQKKISVVMAQMAFPVLARTDGAEAMVALRRRMVQLLTVILYPLLAMLTVLAPVVIPWLFGPEWTEAVVPTQILAAGGAATLTIDTAGAALQAAGRATTLLLFGVAHFVVYIGIVVVVAPHGLAAIGVAAAVVHTAFLVVVYRLLPGSRGTLHALCVLWTDVKAALTSSAALLAVVWPLQSLLRAAGAPVPIVIALCAFAGAIAYGATLRLLFPATWRDLTAAMRRVLPARVTRVGGAISANVGLRRLGRRRSASVSTAD